MSERTIDDHFYDWQSDVFGYGYGTDEEYTLPAIKAFMAAIPADGRYDYSVLENAVGSTVAWLLINTFCQADLISYGTSPRYGWLEPTGKRLKEYLDGKTFDDLVDVLNAHAEDYFQCFKDGCNCGPDGWSKEKFCHNPFWTERGL